MIRQAFTTYIQTIGLGMSCLVCIAGCHSPYVQADVHNASGAPVSLIEVDYPSASFGKDALATASDYTYSFKIIGEGPTKVLWTDAKGVSHSSAGPVLHEGQQGKLLIAITGPTAVWQNSLSH